MRLSLWMFCGRVCVGIGCGCERLIDVDGTGCMSVVCSSKVGSEMTRDDLCLLKEDY